MRQGKSPAGSWEENPPQIMRLLTKTQRRKHAEKQGFWRNCDLVQPRMILQDQTNKCSTPKHKKKKHRPCPARQQRNTFHTCHDSTGIAVAICYTLRTEMLANSSEPTGKPTRTIPGSGRSLTSKSKRKSNNSRNRTQSIVSHHRLVLCGTRKKQYVGPSSLRI
jgi:hypothetical protein